MSRCHRYARQIPPAHSRLRRRMPCACVFRSLRRYRHLRRYLSNTYAFVIRLTRVAALLCPAPACAYAPTRLFPSSRFCRTLDDDLPLDAMFVAIAALSPLSFCRRRCALLIAFSMAVTTWRWNAICRSAAVAYARVRLRVAYACSTRHADTLSARAMIIFVYRLCSCCSYAAAAPPALPRP